MENKLQIFKNEQFGSVRIVEKDGEGWLVAADVCREVDVQNTSDALSRLDDDEKSTIVLTESATNGAVTHKVSIINEAGFYRLVLSSRKKDERVKKFQRWVTHEVLPTIRRTGFYSAQNKPATPVGNAVSDIGIIAENIQSLFAVKRGIALSKAIELVSVNNNLKLENL